MNENQIQQMIIPLTLAALGAQASILVQPKEGEPFKANLRLRDTVFVMVSRWSAREDISVMLPMTPGVPFENIKLLSVRRLAEEYKRRKVDWPGAPVAEEEPSGKN